ncbi:MAG TPA: 2-C-methyl-D-erythritol 4-phosphate cytidylyltransferase [Egibacteraceae bacterium]|nr:2-C-methyl-D-erythritol 4-phosphate cytidylyltransferase [Egibacteraceae bacterium]
MTARAVGLVVAAGTGQRLGAATRKGLVKLAGEPLLVHAVRAFTACDAIGEIVLVVAPADLDGAAAALRGAGLAVGAVVAGGDTRQESVRLGLSACPPDAEAVAVHDAARPLVSADLVTRTVRALVAPWAAVAPGLPIVDTMKLVDAVAAPLTTPVAVVRTVERHGLWAVQTPQVFGARTLRRVHDRLDSLATDDLVLVEQAGGRVRLIEGDRRNFKITFPEDLLIAEALLAGERLP